MSWHEVSAAQYHGHIGGDRLPRHRAVPRPTQYLDRPSGAASTGSTARGGETPSSSRARQLVHLARQSRERTHRRPEDPADRQGQRDPTGSTAEHRHQLAAVPARPGQQDARGRLLARRLPLAVRRLRVLFALEVGDRYLSVLGDRASGRALAGAAADVAGSRAGWWPDSASTDSERAPQTSTRRQPETAAQPPWAGFRHLPGHRHIA